MKDDLEDRLHRLVCDGELDLATAQREISRDWISAYKKYFNSDQPLSTPAGAGDAVGPHRGLTSFRPSIQDPPVELSPATTVAQASRVICPVSCRSGAKGPLNSG